MRVFSAKKSLGLITAFAIAIAGVISPIMGVSPASAAPSLGTNPSSAVAVVVNSTTVLNNTLDASNDLQVTGYPSTDLVRVVVSVDSGNVQLAATTGLSAIQGYTLDTAAHSSIGWQSTQADANTALSGLKYIAGGSAGSANITLTSSYAGASGGGASPAFYAANGHYYQYVNNVVTWAAAEADVANNPLTYTFNGMRGYLATVTSSGENDFVTSRVGSAAVWLGARRDQTNAHNTGTNAWYWTDGPEKDTNFFVQGTGAVNGAFINWNTGEPNGTGTSGESALQLLSGGTGKWNDLQASDGSQNLGYVVEYGGMAGDNQTYASASRVLPITVSTNQIVDVNWTELNFDYANHVNKVGTGTAVNDKVLYQNVTTRNGICVDSVVTTKTISNATITAYDTGTHAGGTPSNFEVDANISAANGYTEFKFDFYVCGTYSISGNVESGTKVILKNAGVTAIDIDYLQWNELSNFDSYTLASDTHLYECPAGTSCNTTHQVPSSYPASLRFQGPSANETNLVQDQVVVNYGSIDTFTIKFGKNAAGTPNYYGVAFKALPWGTATPSTQGGSTTYNITYDGNGSTGGTVPANQTGVTGRNFAVSANSGTLVRTGYTFAGWNTAANGQGTSYSAGSSIMMPNGGTTLYALWTPTGVTLTYDANGGTGAPSSEVRNAGSIANLSSVTPTRTGYTFVRWNTLAAPSLPLTPGTNYNAGASYTMPATATTLYAVWAASTGGLVYNLNGGSASPSITNPTGSQGSTVAVTSTVPTLSGFTFAGWNTAQNGSGTAYAAGSTYTYTSASVTVYAQWVPATLYTLNYNANGATGGPGATSAYAGQSVTLSTNYPTRTGYTCSGWNTQANGLGTGYAGGASYTMPAGNTTLYAVCAANNYHVTYNSNYGTPTTVADVTNYQYLSSVTSYSVAASNFSRANYDLVGWSTTPSGTTNYAPGVAFNMPASDVTLYAVWVLSNIEIRYDANGGTGAPGAASAAATSTYTISPTEPTRVGYTFTGWAAAGNSPATGPFRTGVNGSFVVPAGHVTLVAQWTAITHSLTYDTNGGSAAPTDATAYGYQQTATVSSTVPTKTGYVFLGWNTAANGSGTNYAGGNSLVMLTSNVTLYAQWTANSYRLTYIANGGSGAPAFENRVFATSAPLSATLPTRTGYTFNGWNTVADGSGTNYAASDPLTMPGNNLTLYAQWLLNSGGVTYNANGGSGAPAGANFNFGASVTVSSTVPAYTGYTFTGWNTRCDGTGTPYSAGNVFTMGASSVELCAQWVAVSYQLIYDGNGGTGVPNASAQAYNSTVTTTSGIPNRPGYTFISWNTSADGTGTPRPSSGTFTMPAANVTLYAIWSLNAYTVYYNMNGGSGSVAPQPARYGNSVTVSNATPTRTGFNFSGWNTQAAGNGTAYAGGSSLTVPASNVTLYAQWTPIDYAVNYSANGGTGAPSAQTPLNAGASVTLSSTVPSQTGYQFNGWNTRADGTGINYLSGGSLTMPAANVTLYAVWVPNILDLLYNANGGTGAPAAATAATSSTVTVTSVTPTRAGYNFTGWNTAANGSGTAQANGSMFTMPGTALTLYAQWTPKNITLHYDLNGGAANPGMPAPADVTQNFNTTTQLAPANTFGKTNASFIGWNTAADGSGTAYAAESDFTMPDSDVTLYAQWLGVYYVVEYNANGGSGEPAAQLAAAGQSVAVATQAPTLNGYEFTGWTEVTQGVSYTPGAALTMPATNITMLANYRVRSASVGGSTPVTTPVTPTPPVEPTPPPVVEVKPLTVKEVVYFKGDKADLLPATITALKKLMTIAKSRGAAVSINIIGRVKETADKSYDLKLSKARAVNVANYLKKAGLKGPYSITAAGISPENKWISRRVEISVTWGKK